MEIITIPAKKQEQKILRVAAYARVSADKDAAFHSLEAQTDYYDSYIPTHPDWQLVGIYSDKAISGTKADRPEFQRLLKDCREHKIDLVVTKSITRFARNTVVLLETVRELKALGIDCYFEKENMHSISPDGELMLTLLAMYAEEEAKSVSENQKWRIKHKFEQGIPTTGRMLGYRLKDGKFEIVPEEAEIVRRIYREFLNGKGPAAICRDLTDSGIEARFADSWSRGTVHGILTNYAYTGNLILQRSYITNFHTKKRAMNNGEVPQYRATNTHEAIISEEDFDRVQEILDDNRTAWKEARKFIPEEEHFFSGILICGLCGHGCQWHSYMYNGRRIARWECGTFCQHGKSACPSRMIPETVLIEKAKDALETEVLTREQIQAKLERILLYPDKLDFHFKTGEVKTLTWQPHSRKESWTPEMKQAMKEQAIARNQERYLREFYNKAKE